MVDFSLMVIRREVFLRPHTVPLVGLVGRHHSVVANRTIDLLDVGVVDVTLVAGLIESPYFSLLDVG
jgi:hypothetical protein